MARATGGWPKAVLMDLYVEESIRMLIVARAMRAEEVLTACMETSVPHMKDGARRSVLGTLEGEAAAGLRRVPVEETVDAETRAKLDRIKAEAAANIEGLKAFAGVLKRNG